MARAKLRHAVSGGYVIPYGN